MNIKFKWDDDLTLNKTIEIQNATIVVRAVFLRWMPIWIINNLKTISYKKIDMSEGIVLIKQANQKSAIFVTTGIF